MELCERIKSLRLKRGLTQKELGEQLDVSTVSIRHWETGTKSPSMSAIISLAQIFRVSTDYLLGVAVEQERDNALLTKGELTLLCLVKSSIESSRYTLSTRHFWKTAK